MPTLAEALAARRELLPEERDRAFDDPVVLAGLSDQALERLRDSGQITEELFEQASDIAVEQQRASERSTGFNILNAIGQDLGLVGEAGTSDVERAGNLGLLALSLVPGGGFVRGATGATRAGSTLKGISTLTNLIRRGAGAARRRPGRTAAAGGAGVLGAGVLTNALGGSSEAPPTPEELGADSDELDPTSPTTDQAIADLEAAIAEASSSDTGTAFGEISGFGEANVQRLTGPEGNDLGASIITIGGDSQILFDDELPAFREQQRQAELARAEEQTAFERGLQERELALRESEFQRDTLAQLPSLLQAFADPSTQLLQEAGLGRLSGQLEVGGEGVPAVLRGLFGLGQGSNIPLPGAERTSTVNLGGEGEGLGRGEVTERAGDLDLDRVPTQAFLQGLSGEEQDILNALLTIGGTNPEDVQKQARRLAPPGSGRSVVGMFRR